MQKEIFEQPAVIGDTLKSFLHPLNRNVELPDLGIDFAAISRITISACGTAYLAVMVTTYWFEQIARPPVEVAIASYVRSREAPITHGGARLFLPQTGSTLQPHAPMRSAKLLR